MTLDRSAIFNACEEAESSECKLEVLSDFDYEQLGWIDEHNNLLDGLDWEVGYPQLNG